MEVLNFIHPSYGEFPIVIKKDCVKIPVTPIAKIFGYNSDSNAASKNCITKEIIDLESTRYKLFVESSEFLKLKRSIYRINVPEFEKWFQKVVIPEANKRKRELKKEEQDLSKEIEKSKQTAQNKYTEMLESQRVVLLELENKNLQREIKELCEKIRFLEKQNAQTDDELFKLKNFSDTSRARLAILSKCLDDSLQNIKNAQDTGRTLYEAFEQIKEVKKC